MIETTVPAMLAAGLALLALGTLFGVLIMCLMAVASDADDRRENR